MLVTYRQMIQVHPGARAPAEPRPTGHRGLSSPESSNNPTAQQVLLVWVWAVTLIETGVD